MLSIFIITLTSTTALSQTTDSTSVKITDIRSANKIFAEHSAYIRILKEKDTAIAALKAINFEEVAKNQRLERSLVLKDSMAVSQKNIWEAKFNDQSKEIKASKKKTRKAIIVAVISTIITTLLLIK